MRSSSAEQSVCRSWPRLRRAALELKRKVAALGLGAGLLIGSVVFALFALGFALAGGAVGLASVLAAWLALLIVAAGLIVIAAVLGVAGLGAVKRGAPPV